MVPLFKLVSRSGESPEAKTFILRKALRSCATSLSTCASGQSTTPSARTSPSHDTPSRAPCTPAECCPPANAASCDRTRILGPSYPVISTIRQDIAKAAACSGCYHTGWDVTMVLSMRRNRLRTVMLYPVGSKNSA